MNHEYKKIPKDMEKTMINSEIIFILLLLLDFGIRYLELTKEKLFLK